MKSAAREQQRDGALEEESVQSPHHTSSQGLRLSVQDSFLCFLLPLHKSMAG